MNSAAKKESHTPFIPHSVAIKIAQIAMAMAPLNIEATKACLTLAVAAKNPIRKMLIPAMKYPRK